LKWVSEHFLGVSEHRFPRYLEIGLVELCRGVVEAAELNFMDTGGVGELAADLDGDAGGGGRGVAAAGGVAATGSG
jgi:hypothetical protein